MVEIYYGAARGGGHRENGWGGGVPPGGGVSRVLCLSSILVLLFLLGVLLGQCTGVAGDPGGEGDIEIAVILPTDNRWGFSLQRVLPAISLALEKVHNMTLHPRAKALTIHVNNADSKCHIAEAINQAFNFYMEKKVSVILGPCCDYAAAPVARQLTFWNLPLITAGAMASDFGLMKKSHYPLVTRVGANINSLARVIFAILDHFKWSKVKLVYNPDGQGEIAEKFCHFTADGLHRAFLSRQLWGQDFEQDYFKFLKWSDFGNKMPSEIGLEYAGRSNLTHY